MIGIGFKVEVKKSRVLTDAARVISIPLVEMLEFLASRIFARVQRGQGPHGPWDTYGAQSRDPKAGSYFWVAPDKPQPDGYVFVVESGQWHGWAAYESIKSYYKAAGKLGRPHTFRETGELMSRARIRILSARQVRLAFYGGHGDRTAKEVARLASRNEDYPLLMPSPREVQEAQAFAIGRIGEEIVKAGVQSEQLQRLASKSRGLATRTRRLSRLLGD